MEATTQTNSTEQAQTEQAQATETKRPFNQVELSDGRIATVRRPKGRDMRDAERLVPESSATARGLALASIVTSVNGEGVTYEEFLDWDWSDCEAVVDKYQAMQGK